MGALCALECIGGGWGDVSEIVSQTSNDSDIAVLPI